jgi:hypothetical protein
LELTSKVEDEKTSWKNAQQMELQLFGFQKFQFFFKKSKDTIRVYMVEEVSPNVVVVVIVVVVTTPSIEVEAQQSISN